MKQKRITQDEAAQTFLKSLKALRKAAALTQIETAKRLGISPSTYIQYENGYILPSLQRFMRLAEFFNYDLSGSINHKRYYGGLHCVSEFSGKVGKKIIYPDEPAKRFLSELKNERKKAGLTLMEAAGQIGCDYTTLYDYEHKKCYPMLERFIRLSELYEYDVSESINYKYFHRTINPHDLRKSINRFGLSVSELSHLTGYERSLIIFTLKFHERGSIGCLAAILDVIKREKQSEQYRKKLLRQSHRKEISVRQGIYTNRRRK